MLTHLKAWGFVKRNAIHQCVKTLWIDEKDAQGFKLQTHPSCAYNLKTDDLSKNDSIYQKSQQSHPQFYFNNLGLVHMKQKKYSMAIYYLSKAVKFLEKSNDKTISNPLYSKMPKLNPNETLSNTSSQKSYEIVFNYGLALFKTEKYWEAFKCFEKVSLGNLRHNPKLWYYMGVCALNINRRLLAQTTESEVFAKKLGYKPPSYEKQPDHNQVKRFLLEQKGDPVCLMEQAVKDFEGGHVKDQKKVFVEIMK